MDELKIKIVMQYVYQIEVLAFEKGKARMSFDLNEQLDFSNQIRELKRRIKKELDDKDINYNDYLNQVLKDNI